MCPLNTQAKNKLVAAQRNMESNMLNITEKIISGCEKDKGDRRDWTSQKMEMDRAPQEDTKIPMDTAYHNMEILRMKKT